MMRFLTCTGGIFLLTMTSVFGIQLSDVVYLSDGTVLSGFITEQVPDQSYTIETMEGEELTIPAAEIERSCPPQTFMMRTGSSMPRPCSAS